MGLGTIDPQCHKVQTKLYKIPKFGVNCRFSQYKSSGKLMSIQIFVPNGFLVLY